MKSHWLGWVGATLSLCGIMACGKGHVIVARNLGIPTIEGLPVITNQAHLPVHGKRTAKTEVWVAQGAKEGRLAPSADSTAWTGALDLQQGLNTVFVYAKDGSNTGSKSPGYTVLLDTTPPGTPTVYAPDAVNVGGSGTVTTVISGTKDSDAGIAVNGNVLIPSDGLTAWTTTITVALGDNSYVITAVDAAGNVSTPVSISIFGSTLSTPLILVPDYADIPPNFNPNDRPFLTNNPNAHFVGSKQGNTNLYVFLDGAGVDVGFLDITTWDHTFVLGADGVYNVGVQVKKNGTEQRSGTARVKIMLKTTRPQKPVISSPSFPVADTGDASITLSGTLPSPDSYLCVSNTPGGTCIAQSNNYGGSFTVPTPLLDATRNNAGNGGNPLYISARDAYGNISDEIAQNVYRIAPPTVVLVAPVVSGSTGFISGATLPVSVNVIPDPGDDVALHPGAAIHNVRVCLGMACADAVGNGSGTYTLSPDFSLAGFLNGSVHPFTVTASNSLPTPVQTHNSYSLIYSDGSPIWVSSNDPNQPAQNPRSAFDSSGNLHVVWSDFCGQGACPVANTNQTQPPDIFYAKRDTTGAWTPPKLVSTLNTQGDGASRSPDIAIDNADNVHIVWADDGPVAGKPSSLGIVHRVLSHTGTLGTPVPVGNASQGVDDVDPSAGIDPAGTLHVAFTRHTSGARFDIMYARYAAGTPGSWGSPILVTKAAQTGTAERPSLAGVMGGSAHIAWQECRGAACGGTSIDPNHDIFLASVDSNGAVSGATLVSDSTADGDSLQPSLGVDHNGRDWVFWRDTATQGSGNGGPHRAPSNIWLQQYDNGSKVPSSLSIISNDSSTHGNVSDPNFAAEQPMVRIGVTVSGDQRIALVWTQGNPTTGAINIASKANLVSRGYAGLINEPMKYVFASPSVAQQACVALDSTDTDHLFVVWNDTSSYGAANTGGAEQIFFQVQGP